MYNDPKLIKEGFFMDKIIKEIEDMSLNAWPSHKMELYDGWILRFSYFYTHRTNSVEQFGTSTLSWRFLSAKQSMPDWAALQFLRSVLWFLRILIIFWKTATTKSSIQQMLWQPHWMEQIFLRLAIR